MAYTDLDKHGSTLESAVLRSVDAATEISPADIDEGIIEVARRYAKAIDDASNSELTCKHCGEEGLPDKQALTKALYLGPHLVNALRELGLTPAARHQAQPEERADPRDAAFDELERKREERKGS